MAHLQKLLPIGHQFIELEQVTSTNTYAMQQIQAKMAQHGIVYFAYEQTMGRGQHGKKWLTEPKANIILSTIVNTSSLGITNQFYLSAVTALAVFDLLNFYLPNQISIKWPNDVYINDSKAAGILVENTIQGNQWPWAVLGIGINVNQTSFNTTLNNATSIATYTQKNYNTIDLAKQLCTFLTHYVEQLFKGNTVQLLQLYNEHLYKRNQQVKLKKDNIAFTCTIQKVEATGKLHVLNGLQDEFNFGEVEWLLNK